MMKKLMSLGLVGILSVSLMVGCSSNDNKDDDTVTIKYVDQNGNVKREKVTKEEAKQIERKQQTTKDNSTTKKEQPKKEQTTKEQPKDEDDMTDDEMQEKGLIKKNGGHLEEEAKKQEKMHEAEDNNEGKYPIRYDADGTQINDEYGNYTPEYEQKRDNSGDGDYNYWDHHDHVITRDELDEQGEHYNDYEEHDDTSNIDSDAEESPSEPVEQN